jgi:hypothetical protein
MATQIEETLKRIQTSDGVIGFVIINNAGMLSITIIDTYPESRKTLVTTNCS